jgi:hypothetical protein
MSKDRYARTTNFSHPLVGSSERERDLCPHAKAISDIPRNVPFAFAINNRNTKAIAKNVDSEALSLFLSFSLTLIVNLERMWETGWIV